MLWKVGGDDEVSDEALERVRVALFGTKEEVEQLLQSLGFPADE